MQKKYANISPFRTNVSIHDNNWPDFSFKSDELVLGVDDIISAEATTNKSYTYLCTVSRKADVSLVRACL